jgi:hypothetical protein
MATVEKTPTASQMYDSLSRISDIVNRALRDMGKIEGKNALGSEEDLRYLVLDVSKKIIEQLPALQLERDDIEDEDSRYCHLLAKLADPAAYRTNDFEVTG